MLELMLNGISEREPPAILDINFNRQSVGDTNIIDWSGKQTFSLFKSGTVGEVIHDPVMGNVMNTDGCIWATEPGAFIGLTDLNYRLEMVYKADTTKQAILYCTGTWSGTRIPGTTVATNYQDVPGDVGLWTDDGHTYKTLVAPGPGISGQWETLTVDVKTTSTMDLTLKSTGKTYSSAYHRMSKGNRLAIAGWYGYATNGVPFAFKGLIKSIKMTTTP